MKVLAPLALTAVAVFALAGCSNAAAESAPDDASHEDFCAAADELLKADDEDSADDAAGELIEVGTPSDMTKTQREGFEVVVGDTLAADSDTELNESDYDGDDKALAEAFGRYLVKTCSDS